MDILLPRYIHSASACKLLVAISLVGDLLIFVSWGYIFYRLMGKAIKKESMRQLSERNMEYSRICHDLKTPMTSVQGFAAALRDGKIRPEEQKEIFDIIYSKSCYMNELVESMFAYSKLGIDDFKLILTKTDLGALVRGIVAIHYDEFEKRQMELQLDIPEEPMTCMLDEKEMKRSISNLIINAYKHNPDGAKVMIKVYHNQKAAYVVVADSGNPIPKEQESGIFEPFMCGNEARTSGNGNGLGLTISHQIIKKHGGGLYLKKNISGYTKGFVAQIPLADERRCTREVK